MKLYSRIMALLLAAIMVLTVTGCHQKNETVMTVGEVTIPSGLYLAFQLEGYSELMNGINEQLQASSAASKVAKYSDYFNYEYEGKKGADYVAAKAEALAVEYALVQSKFTEYGLQFEKEDTNYIDSYSQYYWENSIQRFYEANGVNFETYKKVVTFQFMRSKIFDYYYNKPDKDTGKGGLKQVADKDLTAALGDQYILADYFSISLTPSSSTDNTASYTDEQIKQFKTKLDGYAQRINKGESYTKIYKEHNSTEPEENTNATSGEVKTIYPATASAVSSNDSNTAVYDLFKAKKDEKGFAYKTAYVLGGKDAGAYYLAVFYDIAKDPFYLDQYRSTLLYNLKNDEFTAQLAEDGKALTITKDSGLLSYYKPTNIDYDSVSSAS